MGKKGNKRFLLFMGLVVWGSPSTGGRRINLSHLSGMDLEHIEMLCFFFFLRFKIQFSNPKWNGIQLSAFEVCLC